MALPPGLLGFAQQRQMAGQEQNQQLGMLQGLLGVQQAQRQQQDMARDSEFRGLLGQAMQTGDPMKVQQVVAQFKPESMLQNFMPKQPKLQVAERYNDVTGRPEKVVIDLNDPTKVMPLGGQKASPVQIAPNGIAFDPLATKPGASFQDPSKLVVMGPDNKPMVNPIALQAKRDVASAGAARTSVEVNPALDPFKNEAALRGEFRSNPVVKNADEMAGAFRLIETAYKNPSPANDLAMATKYMKVLDPTSVVRESELALAMGSVGLLDKVYNYAQMVSSGQKLTPTQRKDFYDSAKAINEEFQKGKSGVSSQYKGIAQQYKLSPENVTLEKPSSGWGIQKVD